jgi:hypothetical protein
MQRRHRNRLILISLSLLAAGTSLQCKSSGKGKGVKNAAAGEKGSMPNWVVGDAMNGDKVCAVGIAGRASGRGADLPKQLSRERAVKNLAGVFETMVQEAQIDKATNDGNDIEFERGVSVAQEMIERVDGAAEADYWIDDTAAGPFEEKGFTYARACVGADFLKSADFDPSKLVKEASASHLTSEKPPPWLTWIGSQKGARLCAVGFSLPTMHPEETFENVVEEIRGQLTKDAKTLVSSLSEEFSVCRAGGTSMCQSILSVVTAATTEAVSQGVLVTHFWFDRKGVGPNQRRRTTYGWGCAYPVAALNAAVAKVKEKLPDIEVPTTERVKMRAEDFFDELEAEEAKHAAGNGSSTAAAPDAPPAAVQ